MATPVNAKPSVTNDNDSVSLNSTVPSEAEEGYMYIVEGILAERQYGGLKQYLVKWEGYPDVRCTWETESNFGNPETLREWEHQKMRIKRGLVKPYDVRALNLRVEDWLAETENRKARRRAKRLRLGLPVASEEPDQQPDEELNLKKETPEASISENMDQHNSISSSEVTENDLVLLISPQKSKVRGHRRMRSDQSTTIKSESDETHSQLFRGLQTRAVARRRKRVASPLSPDEDVDMNALSATDDSSTQDSLLEDIKAKGSKKLRKKLTEPRRTRGQRSKDLEQVPGNQNSVLGLRLPKKNTESLPSTTPQKIQKQPRPLASPVMKSGVSKFSSHKAAGSTSQQLGRVGRGPAKIGKSKNSTASSKISQVNGAAILSNWDSSTKVRKGMALQPGEALPEPEKPRKFKKLSVKRKYEKAGRQEPAPNPDQLTFVDLKDGKAIKRPDKILTRPIPNASQQIEDQNQRKSDTSPTTIANEMDAVDIAENDDTSMVLDTQVESPQTADADLWTDLQTQDPASCKREGPFTGPTNPTMLPNEFGTNTSGRDSQPLPRKTPSPPLNALWEPELDVIRRESLRFSDTSHSTSLVAPVDLMNVVPKSTSKANFVVPISTTDGLETQYENAYPHAPADVPSISYERMKDHHIQNAPGRLPPPQSFNTLKATVVQPRYPITAVSIRELRGDNGLKPNMAQFEDILDKYNIEDLSDVFGTIIIGINRRIKRDVRFRGLNKSAKQLFMTIKVPPREMHVWCKQICTASDYRSYFHNEERIYYGAGHIVPWPNTSHTIDSIAETLANCDACGVFMAAQFTMLVYPAGVESWRIFDDKFPQYSPDASLRFVLRASIPEFPPDLLNNTAATSTRLIMAGENGPNAAFKKYFGLDYAMFIPHGKNNKDTSQPAFYLLYPVEQAEECSVLVRWLEANEVKIYSSFKADEWEQFQSAAKPGGVVLIHDSITKIHTMPQMARVLRYPVNIFLMNLRACSPPSIDSAIVQYKPTRIFPHGAAILLTDSLFLYHPRDVVRILSWFRINILYSKPYGTWKIVTRPRPREWMLRIIEDRSKEEGRVYLEIYEQIFKILPFEVMDEDDDFETPKDEAPWACSRGISSHDLVVGLGDKNDDKDKIAANDNSLVEWFAGWSRTKVEYHRKFHIVHGVEEEGHTARREWAAKWTYIMALPMKDFMKIHAIAEWEVKDKAKAEERLKEKERRKVALEEEIRRKRDREQK